MKIHRFAISYQRKLQSKKLLSRELTEINGIGKQKADKLLKHFKTISKIRKATKEELMQVKGISQQNATEIIQYFSQN
jgi:excinuclease ABC subunit C